MKYYYYYVGYPSELYYRGSAMWEIIYGMMSAYPIVCFMFVPVYFNLGITSVYQYIDLRWVRDRQNKQCSHAVGKEEVTPLSATSFN